MEYMGNRTRRQRSSATETERQRGWSAVVAARQSDGLVGCGARTINGFQSIGTFQKRKGFLKEWILKERMIGCIKERMNQYLYLHTRGKNYFPGATDGTIFFWSLPIPISEMRCPSVIEKLKL